MNLLHNIPWIKVAAIHEVQRNPEREHWHEARLPLRFREIRVAIQ